MMVIGLTLIVAMILPQVKFINFVTAFASTSVQARYKNQILSKSQLPNIGHYGSKYKLAHSIVILGEESHTLQVELISYTKPCITFAANSDNFNINN